MSLQIVIDMNLSPEWVTVLKAHIGSAVHWSSVGNTRATDQAIMAWALRNQFLVFTHDLDFGTVLEGLWKLEQSGESWPRLATISLER